MIEEDKVLWKLFESKNFATGGPKQVQSADVLKRKGFTENVSCSIYVQNEPGAILWFQLMKLFKCGFQRNLLSRMCLELVLAV